MAAREAATASCQPRATSAAQHLHLLGHGAGGSAEVGLGDDVEDEVSGRGDIEHLRAQWSGTPADVVTRCGPGAVTALGSSPRTRSATVDLAALATRPSAVRSYWTTCIGPPSTGATLSRGVREAVV